MESKNVSQKQDFWQVKRSISYRFNIFRQYASPPIGAFVSDVLDQSKKYQTLASCEEKIFVKFQHTQPISCTAPFGVAGKNVFPAQLNKYTI